MEEQWIVDRARLRDLLRERPTLTQKERAQALGRSLSWVKKWQKRLKEAHPTTRRCCVAALTNRDQDRESARLLWRASWNCVTSPRKVSTGCLAR